MALSSNIFRARASAKAEPAKVLMIAGVLLGSRLSRKVDGEKLNSTAICRVLGIESPTKRDTNKLAAYLQQRGFEFKRLFWVVELIMHVGQVTIGLRVFW